MSQATDYVLSNQSGASFRAELNTILAAIASANSGATEPTTTYAYMLWADESSGILKQRNAADNAWVEILNLADGSVIAIGDDAVTTAKIADDAVTTAKLAFDGGALGNRNILINAGFRVNQRAYLSGAVLAAGAYGHDRFKAGASGGDYSFTQLNTNTQITIASGKSLIQVVEDLNVHETAYVLSWEGTAQARVGVNSATPSGAYASSPILITGQTAGTTMSVEFNTGTLGKAQLEKGTIATPFENRTYEAELANCYRYYYRIFPASTASIFPMTGYATGTTGAGLSLNFPTTMRIDPTSLEQSGVAANYALTTATGPINCSAVPTFTATTNKYGAQVSFTVASGLTSGDAVIGRTGSVSGASAYLGWSAEL